MYGFCFSFKFNQNEIKDIGFAAFNNLLSQATQLPWNSPDKLYAKYIPHITKEIYLQYGMSGYKPSKFESTAAKNNDMW